MNRWSSIAVFASLLGVLACIDTEPEKVGVPPTVNILEPDDSGDEPEYLIGDEIHFVATATDNLDTPEELVVVWDTTWIDEFGVEQTADLGATGVGPDGRTNLVTAALEVGAHTVRVSATDTDNLTSYDYVSVRVILVNEHPTVQITAPLNGAMVDENAAVLFTAVVTDDHDLSALDVEWSSSVQGFLDNSSPGGNGAVQFQTSLLEPGEHTITVTVTDELGQEDSDSIDLTCLAENLPPTVPTVLITPQGAGTDDDLTCIATGSSDPEGGLVTYGYSWDQDGFPTGFTSDVVGASQTAEGEEWTCHATPEDPTGLQGPEGWASLIVGNTLPSFSSVSLTPSPAYEDTILTCTPYGWFDPDGDPEGAQYEWWVDGSGAPSWSDTLDGTWFDHFDEVYCVVYPDDGSDVGFPLQSNTITIENTAPQDPQIFLDPQPLHTDEELECLFVMPTMDIDGDMLTHEYEWLRNGVPEPGLTTSLVSDTLTEIGEQWTCRVRADDGILNSGWTEVSTHVVPYEGDLVITELMIDPDEVTDADGEYIEIYNNTGEAIGLDGFALQDGGADYHLVSSGGAAYIAAGDYFVLGLNSANVSNGGVDVDYQYTDFELGNGPDVVELEFGGVIVDAVAYDWGLTFPAPTGQSMSLADTLINHIDNDDGASWCGSTSPIFEWGDFGTPGVANDSCDCWISDLDGDGFGVDPVACPPQYLDCDDTDALINPAAFDICWDGIDQDCDGVDRECTCAESDGDGDGFGITPDCPQIDCDDNNAAIYPGAPELCNLVDDDCDGTIDEGYDADGDGWTTCGGDCNDGNALSFPGNTEACDGVDNDCDNLVDEQDAVGCFDYHEDLDSDGYGSANSQCLCFPTGAYSSQWDTDCDDLNASIHPFNTELCNGIDDDCDGSVDEGFDVDGDGVTSCGGDCNDNNADVYPGNVETCDGLDNDCDSLADEDQDAINCTEYHLDVDGDTYGITGDWECWCSPQGLYRAELDGDCDDTVATTYPGATELCNGVDDDCDGTPDDGLTFLDWFLDVDDDGHGDPATVQNNCSGSPGLDWVQLGDDCDDTDANNFPTNNEVCDGADNDCDGIPDDGLVFDDWYLDNDGDGHGDPALHVASCDGSPGLGWVALGDDCDDADPNNYPGNTEVCDNADNDCDGIDDNGVVYEYWYFDSDGDLHGDPNVWVYECSGAPSQFWVALGDDCDDSDANNYPGNNEICDGLDNDCDGVADNGVTYTWWYDDSDGDGHGDPATGQNTCDGPPWPDWVQTNDDCDDNDAQNFPGNTEQCDGADNDCDGIVDNGITFTTWYLDLDGDGHGNPNVSESTCDGPPGGNYVQVGDDCDDADITNFPGNTEICDGDDEDCDGIIDEGHDADGDGWTWCNGDCNDGNNAIYPGAPENCDSYDNDCDGQTDEGQDGAGCQIYYHDGDNDGYGDPNDSQCLCFADTANDYDVQDNQDCNDNNASIHPGVTDPCDGVDNDCDGQTDEDYLTNCSVAQGTPGCSGGACYVVSCWATWYDMINGYSDGCESQEDGYEGLGGDSCAAAINMGTLRDYDPSQGDSVIGNIVPVGDVDVYQYYFQDIDGDGGCDDFNIDISIAPTDQFGFVVQNTSCNLVSCGTGSNSDLSHYEWNATGECGCTTGDGGCEDDSIYLRIEVYRETGGPNDDDYTLTINNG